MGSEGFLSTSRLLENRKDEALMNEETVELLQLLNDSVNKGFVSRSYSEILKFKCLSYWLPVALVVVL
ncbi:hypothetical protein BT69DRAFT_133621 [Atractiella rhizophila]|nr:hypothetical protein BT69DRAFT_133621 [Atractiella rhizophila]